MNKNAFRQALLEQRPQIGFWAGIGDPYCTEICASAGFDWLLLDAEHGPNDVRSLLPQLQVVAGYPATQAVVRPPSADPVLIKQYLDIGAQNILVPMIDTPEQAKAVVAATRYPPVGIRGVGTALARAARWGTTPEYLQRADGEIGVMVQIETKLAIQNVGQIAAVEGVDGVFIGASDLAASLGYRGQAKHPEVQAAVESGIAGIRRANKAVGMLTTEEALIRRYLELGCTFVAVGIDTAMLVNATRALAQKYRKTDSG